MNIEHKKTALDDDSLLYQKRDESFGKKDTSAMNTAQKIVYYKDYYLKTVLAVIAVLIVAGALVYTIFFRHQENILTVAFLNEIYLTDTDGLTEDLREFYELTNDNDIIDVSNYNLDDYTAQMRFTTFSSAHNMDVVFCTEEDFEDYCSRGFFVDLSEYLPADLYGKIKDRIVESSQADYDDDGNVTKTYAPAPYGIDVSGNVLYRQYGGEAEHVIAGVLVSSERADNVIRFLEHLLFSEAGEAATAQ